MQGKRVSIVMCTYNGERFLREQLESLLGQTRQADEIIIQDDHSTDGTWQLLQEYAAGYPQIRLFTNEAGRGVNNNFFSALRRATGDYIAISDQDDIWDSTKMEKQLAAIGDKLLCTCRSKPFSTDGSPVNYDSRTPNYHLARMLYSSIAGHTVLIVALAAASNDSVVLVNEVLVNQRRHEDAATFTRADSHRTPSVGNAFYTLSWSIRHYREMQPYLFDYFQRRYRLMQGIQAEGELYEDVTAMAGLEGKPGLCNVLYRGKRCRELPESRPLLHHARLFLPQPVTSQIILIPKPLRNCCLSQPQREFFVVSLQRDLVPGVTASGEKGTGCESRTDGAAVCPW